MRKRVMLGVFRLSLRMTICLFAALWAIVPPDGVDTPLRVFMVALSLYLLTTSEATEERILRGEADYLDDHLSPTPNDTRGEG